MTAPQPAPDRRPGFLGEAIFELRDAITRLVEPHRSYLHNTFTMIPSLYDQLSTAVAGQQSNAGQGGGSKSRPPFWTDAADKMFDIDLVVGANFPTGRAGSTVTQLRAMANRAWDRHDASKIRKLTKIINSWADDIEALLNHEHVAYLRGAACPACGADMVQKADAAGEYIRSPALQVHPEHGAFCQNCEAYWSPEYFMDLGRQLGLPTPAGVLE